jgi:hypothetical protein
MSAPVTINVGTSNANTVAQAGSHLLNATESSHATGATNGVGSTTATKKSGTTSASERAASKSKSSQASGGDFFSNLLGAVLNFSAGGSKGGGGFLNFLFAAIPVVGPIAKGFSAVASLFSGKKSA